MDSKKNSEIEALEKLIKNLPDQDSDVFKKITLATQRMEFILEGAGLGAWDWWLESNRVTFDRRWCEMIGLKMEETPQELATWDSRVHPDDKEKAYRDIKAYMNGETAIYENVHRLRHENGSWVWILDRGRISERDESGKPIRFSGTHFDITKEKEAERLLEEAQEAAKIGSWSYEARTKKKTWSKQMYKIFGIEAEQGPIDEKVFISRLHPEDRTKMQATMKACLEEGKPYRIRYRLHRNGEIAWIESHGDTRLDAQGKLLHVFGTSQDITERVLAEEKLKQERAKALHSAKLASLGEMSAGIAHEINNPLAIISGNIRLLPRYFDDVSGMAHKIQIIEKAVDRIAKIVTGLRRFSRSYEKREYQFYDLSKIIQEAVLLTDVKANRNETIVSSEIKGNPRIFCDDIEVEQVLVNLINNGIDAVRDHTDRWVKIQAYEEASSVVIRVYDSGSGIEQSIQEKLFQPFFTTKEVGQGTGLGLSITKGILEEHQATIELLDKERNTCFEIRFPKK